MSVTLLVVNLWQYSACMLYKITLKPMHPLYDALPVPYVPVRVTCGAMFAHRYIYEHPICRALQYHRTFIPLSESLRNDLADPVFDGVLLANFKSRVNAFLLASAAYPLFSTIFPFLFFLSI